MFNLILNLVSPDNKPDAYVGYSSNDYTYVFIIFLFICLIVILILSIYISNLKEKINKLEKSLNETSKE